MEWGVLLFLVVVEMKGLKMKADGLKSGLNGGD